MSINDLMKHFIYTTNKLYAKFIWTYLSNMEIIE